MEYNERICVNNKEITDTELEKLITEDKEYSIILKQSQKLDKLINAKMKEINAS